MKKKTAKDGAWKIKNLCWPSPFRIHYGIEPITPKPEPGDEEKLISREEIRLNMKAASEKKQWPWCIKIAAETKPIKKIYRRIQWKKNRK